MNVVIQNAIRIVGIAAGGAGSHRLVDAKGQRSAREALCLL